MSKLGPEWISTIYDIRNARYRGFTIARDVEVIGPMASIVMIQQYSDPHRTQH